MSDKKTLKQMILNECELQRGLAETLARKSGYSSGSSLRKILKDEKKEFEKFSGLLEIVSELFPNNEKQLMAEYALTLDVKKQTARYMLEYCEINRLNDTKEYLIEQMVNCNNAYSKEWAEIFSIDDKYVKGLISFKEAIASYSSIVPKQPETSAALEIYKSYCYLDYQMYEMIFQSLSTVDIAISEIKDDFIRDMYFGRYSNLMNSCYVRKGELELARKHCYNIIENVDYYHFTSLAYLNLGNSFIIDDFEKSLDCLRKGLKIADGKLTGTTKALKRSLNFLHNVWGKNSEYLDLHSKEATDQHEIAFYYINNKQFKKAEEVLNSIDLEKMSDNQKGFHYYVRGKMTNDLDMFSESVYYFKKSNDFFHRRLPILEMQKLGIPNSVLKALTV